MQNLGYWQEVGLLVRFLGTGTVWVAIGWEDCLTLGVLFSLVCKFTSSVKEEFASGIGSIFLQLRFTKIALEK